MEGDENENVKHTPDGDQPKPAELKRKRGTCLVVALIVLLCAACLIGGAVLYSHFSERMWNKSYESYSSTQSFLLNKEKICQMAFVQQTIMVDTKSEFPWNYDAPFGMGQVEIGRAEAKVKGVFLAKYGIDQENIKVWEYFPETAELQMTKPTVKVIGLQTLFQELDSENESFLKKLQMKERNESFKRNRDDALAQATASVRSDEQLQRECLDQLRDLLASFGIKLVLVDPRPDLR